MINALKNIWRGMVPENPVFVLALGLCSTLAVTVKVENASYMAVMVGLTTVVTSVITSILRFRIPFKFRLLSYMLIIVTAVITAEQLLKVFYPAMARELGAYVGLIVTNCIVMGRMEAYASSHSVFESFCDSLGISLGYGMVLLGMSVIREALGNGTIWSLAVMPEGYVPCKVFSSPPGAFLVFVFLLFVVNWLRSFGRNG